MPELPEVEVAARNLRAWLGGKRITAASFATTRIIRGQAPRTFVRLVVGQRVREVERRGKWLCLRLSSGGALYSHLGMTGKWVRRDGPAVRWERARLDAGEVSVRYVDPRQFGRLIAAPDGAPPEAWRALGPDPLTDGLDPAWLRERLQRTGRSIKEALMDQSIAAGVGNIQAAEALWRARISPIRAASSLSPSEVRRVVDGIEASIRFTLGEEEAPEITYVEEPGADNPFLVYGKAGAPCPRCRTPIRKRTQGGRATFYCPRCQT